MVFVLVTIKFPIRSNSRSNKFSNIANLLALAILPVYIWQYISALLNYYPPINVIEIRIAILIAVIYFLIVMLASFRKGNAILNSLISIRRELMLNYIDLDNVIRQTDIAIYGLNLSDLIAENIGELLSLFRETAMKIKETSTHLKSAELFFTDTVYNEKDHFRGRPLLLSAVKATKDTEKMISTTEEAINRLNTRIQKLKFYGDLDEEENEIRQKLLKAYEEVTTQSNELVDRLTKLINIAGIDVKDQT